MSPTPPTPSSAVAAAVSTSAGSSPTVAPELGKYGFSATPAGFGSFAGPFSGYTYPFSDPAAAMNNPYYTQSAASTAAIHQQAWNYHMGAPSTDALGMHRFTNASSLPGGSSRRKRRVLFNQSQVNHLLMSYKKKKYLTPGEREKLAQETGLSSNQVKIWFQNHRYKCKREGKEFVEGASDPMSPDDEGNGESRSPSQNATELCADVKTEGHSPTIGDSASTAARRISASVTEALTMRSLRTCR